MALPPERGALAGGGRTHPTFVEIGTNEALYVHRTGSNVTNGRYYVDKDPKKTLAHYSSFRRVDTAALRGSIEAATKMSPDRRRSRARRWRPGPSRSRCPAT